MKIYTKKGDFGETSVIAGEKIMKSELLIEANGALDEASSFVGWSREMIEDEKVRLLLSNIQHDLYEIMASLAGVSFPSKILKLRIISFEKLMDKMSATLPALHRFILPQGGETATRLHIARTVVRSAERRVVRLVEQKAEDKVTKKAKENDDYVMIRYLNRLSDMLFLLARKYAQIEKVT